MKSKISCWRLVRSMAARLLARGNDGHVRRTCVRTVARALDGHKGRAANGEPGRARTTVRSDAAAGSAARRAAGGRGPEAILAPPRARGGIGRRARLRALWGVFPVMVRRHSSALAA